MLWIKRFSIFFIIVGALMMWFKNNNPNISAEITIEKSLIKRLSDPIFAIVKVSPKSELKNVLLKVDADVLKLIASDGRRMLVMQGRIETSNSAKFSLTVPYDVIERLANIDLSRGYKTGQISIKNQIITFEFDSVNVSQKYLKANALPAYETFIPTPSNTRVFIEKSKMLKALHGAVYLADNDHRIKIDIANDKMTFTSPKDQNVGFETIDVDYKGEPLTAFYDINYAMEFLKDVVTEDSIVLDFASMQGVPEKYMVARGEDYTYVLLPMTPMRPK